MHHSSFLTPNTLLLLALLALTACSDDVVGVGEKSEWDKTPIEVAVGMQEEVTRAVITDEVTGQMQAMPEGTGVWTAMQSDFNTATQSEQWSYQGTVKDPKYCVTYGTTQTKTDNKAPIKFEGDKVRYWDDAHARSSQLSLWGVAVPGQATTAWSWKQTSDGANVTPTAWSTTATNCPTTIYWAISEDQTATSMATEDLCFSNNLADYTGKTAYEEAKRTDRRLYFDPTHRKFTAGNMVFYHALTKFTIRILCGDGFKGDGTDFAFTQNPEGHDNSFRINGFDGTGNFDVKDGEFKSTTATTFSSINLVETKNQKKDAGPYYTLQAFLMPGTDMTTSVDDAFSFTIQDNKYVLTMAQLYTAIKDRKEGEEFVNRDGDNVKNSVLDNGKTLLPGVNYQFTFIVEKTKINGLTAQVLPWEEVKAEPLTPTNARISLKLEERGDAKNSDIDFYRAKDPGNTTISDSYEGYQWGTGYTTDGKATAAYKGSKWKTDWYWPDNTTFYHMRAVGPSSASINVINETNDYIALTSDVTKGDAYTDYIWGAPFLDDADNEDPGTFKWSYDPEENGFDGKTDAIQPDASVGHQIYHAIGPTTDVIKLLMFHLMSEVKIKVQTTEGADKVSLSETVDGVEKKTTLHFEHLYTQGKAAMGNGLVTTTGTAESTTDGLTMSPTDNVWIYGAIPQPLSGTTAADDLILVITTPDNNRYEVTMKDILASTTPTSKNLVNPYKTVVKDGVTYYKIDRWYPDYKYEYTFTLKKTGIEKIQATILDWEEVVADETEVTIR